MRVWNCLSFEDICFSPGDRARVEEVKVVGKGLRWAISSPPRAIVISGTGLLLGPMSGFMALK